MDRSLSPARPSHVFGLTALLVLLGAAPALGQTAINQTKATNGLGGCDAPGFPITICKSGSYKLTGNLTVSNADTTAIQITASNVTLDLDGFAILGPTACSGDPPSCSPTGIGLGIHATATTSNVRVLNGTIRGMGAHGIQLEGRDHRIQRVHAATNGGTGLAAHVGSIVADNTSVLNGSTGIYADVGSTIAGNAVHQNGGHGIVAEPGSLLIHNAVMVNGGAGLFLGVNVNYSQNAVTENRGGGVSGGIDGGQNVVF